MGNNYAFDVHTYAPELNKIFYKGVNMTKYFGNLAKRLDKDYAKNTSFVREFIQRKDLLDVLFYEVKKEYKNPEFSSYNNIYRGFVTNRANLIDFRNALQAKCIDYTGCNITVKRIYKL